MITTIQLNNLNTVYLVKGSDKYLLVDTPANKKLLSKFLEELDKRGIKLNDIQYILLTHNHSDHCATLADIQKIHTIPLIYHKYLKEYFQTGGFKDPKAKELYSSKRLTSILISLLSKFLGHLSYETPLLQPDQDIEITSEDNDSLRKMGIPAKIIPTPGHSIDSLSVAFDSGEAIIGDLVTIIFTRPIPFIFNSFSDFKQSIANLRDNGIEKLHLSHRGTLEMSEIHKALEKPIKELKVNI